MLPVPTLRNLKEKKRHRVLGMEGQCHLAARLDGPPGMLIKQMPFQQQAKEATAKAFEPRPLILWSIPVGWYRAPQET